MKRPIVFEFQVFGTEFLYFCVPLEFTNELLPCFVPGHEPAFRQSCVFWQLWKDVLEQSSYLLAHELLPNVMMSVMSETSFSWSSYERPSKLPHASSNCA